MPLTTLAFATPGANAAGAAERVDAVRVSLVHDVRIALLELHRRDLRQHVSRQRPLYVHAGFPLFLNV